MAVGYVGRRTARPPAVSERIRFIDAGHYIHGDRSGKGQKAAGVLDGAMPGWEAHPGETLI
jgi:hypothetical protein